MKRITIIISKRSGLCELCDTHRIPSDTIAVEETMNANIDIPMDAARDFCRRHHVKKLALFGSVLRDDFDSMSDVDVLVEFEPGRTPGLAFFSMQRELSEIVGREVDLNTAGFISPSFRNEVLDEARVLYDAA